MSQEKERPLTLSQFSPYRLANLATSVSNACSRVYREQFDISVPEWRVLARLAEQSDLNSKEIGSATFMDKSKVSRAIKLLENKALVTRATDSNDNRAAKLVLTENGYDMYLRIADKALEWESEMLSALNVRETEALAKIMDKLDDKVAEMSDK